MNWNSSNRRVNAQKKEGPKDNIRDRLCQSALLPEPVRLDRSMPILKSLRPVKSIASGRYLF